MYSFQLLFRILGYNKKIIIERILNTSTNKNNEELTENEEEEEIEIEIFDDWGKCIIFMVHYASPCYHYMRVFS